MRCWKTAPLFLLALIACQPESGETTGEPPAGTEMFAAIPDEPPVLANNEIVPIIMNTPVLPYAHFLMPRGATSGGAWARKSFTS